MNDDIVGLIEKNEFNYENVKGLGEKSYEKLREKILSNLHMSEVLIFLAKYNIKSASIKGLIKQFVHPLVVIEKIKAADLEGAIVRAIARSNAAVVGHHVDALFIVHGRIDGTNAFTGRRFTMLAEHRLRHHLRVRRG